MGAFPKELLTYLKASMLIIEATITKMTRRMKIYHVRCTEKLSRRPRCSSTSDSVGTPTDYMSSNSWISLTKPVPAFSAATDGSHLSGRPLEKSFLNDPVFARQADRLSSRRARHQSTSSRPAGRLIFRGPTAAECLRAVPLRRDVPVPDTFHLVIRTYSTLHKVRTSHRCSSSCTDG